jgi:hypothetical protein
MSPLPSRVILYALAGRIRVVELELEVTPN